MSIDKAILQHHDEAVRPRARIELRICRKLLRALKRAGYTVSIWDGEESTPVIDEGEALKLLFNLDEAHLDCHRPVGGKTFVLLVFGNDGWDVISDYGLSLEPLIDAVMEGES
jgi:hypothetical protein